VSGCFKFELGQGLGLHLDFSIWLG